MSKQLFHSELVRAGVVSITVTGNPTASKFKGKPNFVGIILNGEERLLNLENEAIEEFFSGQKGQTFSVQALGGKGNASIRFVEEQGQDDSNPDLAPEKSPPVALNPPKPPIAQKPPAMPPGSQSATLTHPLQPSSTPPRPAPTPPLKKSAAQIEQDAIAETCIQAIRLRNVQKLAFVNALILKREIEEEWPKEKVSEAQLQGFVATLSIQLFRENAQRGMPTRRVIMRDKANGHSAPPPEPNEPGFSFNPQDDIADSHDDGGRD